MKKFLTYSSGVMVALFIVMVAYGGMVGCQNVATFLDCSYMPTNKEDLFRFLVLTVVAIASTMCFIILGKSDKQY